MPTKFLQTVFKKNKDNEAIIWNGHAFSYEWLLNKIREWGDEILDHNIPQGAVVAIDADFSPEVL